ncbi:hypothetical protein PSA7680_01547 [Pseudoruegeria aquimaris]|uniref:Pentapeptide repeats (8 copies) n=1 Tax=Pseudoruegeria aquimaris TaxID=393663 RepID=A0A1Y5S9H2_9RHOB|nr:hypothetical protein [Pseudoruegeria aquimaris]SLN33039.1 hypothetical protein PSA7680_01547 [Pseudoruegeria aquimaris]
MPRPSPDPAFTAECGRCAALCCLALHFDAGARFGISKPAGTPCPNLAGHLCSIHDTLSEAGFPGCVAYDCAGAGQRVTQELFAGASWRDDPALAGPMMEGFRLMRRLQEALQLLGLARNLPIGAPSRARLDALAAALAAPPEGWTLATLHDLEAEGRLDAVGAFLKSLRNELAAPGSLAEPRTQD